MLLAAATWRIRPEMLTSQPPEGAVAPASRSARRTAPASAAASTPFWVTALHGEDVAAVDDRCDERDREQDRPDHDDDRLAGLGI